MLQSIFLKNLQKYSKSLCQNVFKNMSKFSLNRSSYILPADDICNARGDWKFFIPLKKF